ncbi:hypothetical protein SAMN06298226_0342 [Nitrosovibrio sp. Nv4]|nr:hypothetical protein SAMN06298226_0342 [Nitrosovibrio sp. Nv4]
MVLTAPYTPYGKQRSTSEAARYVCREIQPSCMPAGQIHLMPFIKHTDQQRPQKRDDQSAPSRQAASNANCPGEQRKNSTVSQFIPWRRNQVHGDRLRPSNKQADDDPERQQHGCGADGAR